MHQRLLSSLVALTCFVFGAAVGVVALAASPAAAHTERLQSSPAPAQQTGGVVDFVDLIFTDPVSNMVVTLEGPDGEFIDGEMVTSEGQLVRYEMPAISQVGQYLIRYSMTSADGDLTESIYSFTYEPGGPQPLRLGDAQVPGEKSNGVASIFFAILFGLCLVGLAMLFLASLERKRATASGSAGDERQQSPSS